MARQWGGVIMAAAILLTAGSAGAAEVMRIAYEDRAQPPYYIGDGAPVDPVAPGASVDLVKMAAAQAGIEVQFLRMPWTRCLTSLQKGEVDAIFNSSYKEDRLVYGLYPLKGGKPDGARRTTTMSYILYRLKGSPVGWNGSSLTGLNGAVGAPAGFSIVDDLTKMGVKVEGGPETGANFRKMIAGRLAAVAAQDVSGDALLASGQFPQVERVEQPLATKDYFMQVSHQYYAAHHDLAERLWSAIGTLRDSKGAELRAKYPLH